MATNAEHQRAYRQRAAAALRNAKAAKLQPSLEHGLLTPIHKYAPMLGPLEEVPEGSSEWAERLGQRLMHSWEKVIEWGCDRIIQWVDLALNTEPAPWTIFPVGKPCGSADAYFRYAAGTNCERLARAIALSRGDDDPLVRKLRDLKDNQTEPLRKPPSLIAAWDRATPQQRADLLLRVSEQLPELPEPTPISSTHADLVERMLEQRAPPEYANREA